MLIQLSLAEIQVASMVGIQRQIEDLKWKNHDKFGAKRDLAWQRHIEGALTECAMAKYLNVYWNKARWDEPDVGDIDVRASSKPDGGLIIRRNDNPNKKYYLLIGVNGEYEIKGWLYGKDAMKDQFWTSKDTGRPPAWFVPQEYLTSVDGIVSHLLEKDFLDD